MDFDTEAADDFQRAVKNWEDGLPCYLNRAGTDTDDCASDSGLLTPPPECADDLDSAWIVPPPRPTYSDSWVRVMKKRVEEGTGSVDQDSDTSSVSSWSTEPGSRHYTMEYSLPVDLNDCTYLSGSDYDALASSDDSIDSVYKEGSTATAADAADLFAEMLDTYTVSKDIKRAINRTSSHKRKHSQSSLRADKSGGIAKRITRSSTRSSFRSGSTKT